MNRRLLIAPAIITLLIAGGYFVDRSRAARASELSGFFEIQPTLVSSRVGGRVAKILVREGDEVKAGQILIELEARSNEAALAAQRQAAEQARQQYLEAKNGSRQEEIDRQEFLTEELAADLDKLEKGARPQELQIARAQAAAADAQYRKVLSGPRPQEVAAADAAARAALERYRIAQRGLTGEERSQLRSRLEAARAAEDLAGKEALRQRDLYAQGAVSKQQLDAAESAHRQAVAHQIDAEQAYQRAQKGTPPEELAEAKAAYDQAVAQRDLVRRGSRKEDVDAAFQALNQANENLDLVEAGARKEDLDAAAARLKQAQAVLKELKIGNRPEDVARAKAAAQQANDLVTSQTTTVEERVIRAPTDGIVDRITVGLGDLESPGQTVIQMSNPGGVWIRVYVPETALPKIKPGDSADILVDGVASPMKGVVQSVATRGEFTPANLQSPEERAKQVFAVRIGLASPDPRVKAGIYATVKKVGGYP